MNEQDGWTVQDTIRDMTEWLDLQRRTNGWSPVEERVEEWRDELVQATGWHPVTSVETTPGRHWDYQMSRWGTRTQVTWVEIIPGRFWDGHLSQHSSGRQIDRSGVTYIGTLDGQNVARTYDGREWMEVRT